MKILITTDTYSPMINGIVTSVNNLYKELKNKGHEVRILTLSHTGEEKVEKDVYYLRSIKIRIYPEARIINFLLHNKLIKKIIDWGPDTIHSQTEFSMMIVSKYISRKLNIPHIHTYHTMYEHYLNYLFRGRIINKNVSVKITKLLLNSLDGIIAPTEKTRKILLKYKVNKPIYVVPTGIDLSRFKKEISQKEKQEIINKLHLYNEDRIISYIGRIGVEKNISEILMTLPEIIRQFNNIKLLIVGGGPYLNDLKKEAKRLNIERNVVFTGMISSEDIYKYYKISEIFVTASNSETQGLTYIEALSSGCPVVCKYDPCIDSVIESGKNGYVYKEKDEFIYYVSEILKNRALGDRMRQAAVSKADEYSSDIFASRVLDKYYRHIGGNKEVSITLANLIEPKLIK
ncbi:glycosyltransferase family 4 protein [Clostridium chromiireducens]|uniref:Alpha-monoglucosyldiacylglycerol synthase n=1 Tax=Clostridium chromiireducens TaxID=225345 RepID=A0A1V4IZA2_9CLOT|nr:glycosyltransferase family 4 protein [Clostridium chromiireducens]OPJ65381.1 alpha-monoglucosyldiacylglycerol synthase [Clostridium chromiireducens]